MLVIYRGNLEAISDAAARYSFTFRDAIHTETIGTGETWIAVPNEYARVCRAWQRDDAQCILTAIIFETRAAFLSALALARAHYDALQSLD